MIMEYVIAKLLNEFERGRITRRQLIQALALTGATASAVGAAPIVEEGAVLRATGVNHLSYSVPDYKRTRDFYASLFGMQVRGDDGAQCTLAFGDTFIVVRKTEQADHKAYVDHFAISIDDWNKESVEALLKGRGLQPTPDGERSFHVKDPDGFDLQISGARQRR
jgi:catechol 2,3-dioxygenase-like lactoylglutathione lyase family enzyme